MNFKWKLSLINFSIRTKLILSYFILIIIPLCILTLMTYSHSSRLMEEKMIELAEQAMEQINISIQSKIKAAIKYSEQIMYNREIQEILARDIR